MKKEKSTKVSVWRIAILCSLASLFTAVVLEYVYSLRTRHIEMACQIQALDMENRLIHYTCVEKEK